MAMEAFEKLGVFYLGREHDLLRGETTDRLMLYDSKDLVTHAVVLGMTGSGKTGLCLSLLEEAGLDRIPAIAIDPKGDIANLLLTFPHLSAEEFRPWVDESAASRAGMTRRSVCRVRGCALVERPGAVGPVRGTDPPSPRFGRVENLYPRRHRGSRHQSASRVRRARRSTARIKTRCASGSRRRRPDCSRWSAWQQIRYAAESISSWRSCWRGPGRRAASGLV